MIWTLNSVAPEKKDDEKREETTTYYGPGRIEREIEISRRERMGEIKHLQGVCNQPLIVGYRERVGRSSVELLGCCVSGRRLCNAIGTLMEVYDTACDMSATTDA